MATGKVAQVIGPVVDIQFPQDELPEIMNAIHIPDVQDRTLTVEVAQMLGNDIVRCISMQSTDGLVRGMEAIDLDGPITVPVGKETLGRIFNLLGKKLSQRFLTHKGGINHFAGLNRQALSQSRDVTITINKLDSGIRNIGDRG